MKFGGVEKGEKINAWNSIFFFL